VFSTLNVVLVEEEEVEEEEEEEEEEERKRAAVAIRKLPASGYLEGSKGVCLLSYVCEQ